MRGLHTMAATPAILVDQNPFCELIKLINWLIEDSFI